MSNFDPWITYGDDHHWDRRLRQMTSERQLSIRAAAAERSFPKYLSWAEGYDRTLARASRLALDQLWAALGGLARIDPDGFEVPLKHEPYGAGDPTTIRHAGASRAYDALLYALAIELEDPVTQVQNALFASFEAVAGPFRPRASSAER
jgi:hypothetical protein